MTDSTSTSGDNTLDDLIAQFLEAIERGESPNRQQLIKENPKYEIPLQAFFRDLDNLNNPIEVEETEAFKPAARQNKQIDNYVLVDRIGSGGMGEVWVAEQKKPVKRRVALKLIKAGMDSKSILSRFEVERQALAAIDHPNVAKILDAGTTPSGHPYFVMELVNGAPLTKFCDGAKLTIRERLELMVQISSAVQHAHHKGIVHRDLKPANILVTVIDGKPVPKIIDFGLAKALGGRLTDESFVTSFGTVMGTMEYMAPEQAGYSGQDVDTRADIYSLGVLLYELLTGLLPFDSARLRKAAVDEMLRIIREEDPIRPSTRLTSSASAPSSAAVRRSEPRQLAGLLRSELDWIVMKSLEKDRNRRYETAGMMAKEIVRFLANEPIEARPPTPLYRVRKYVLRHKVTAAWVATLTVLLIAATVVSTMFAIQASLARQREAVANENRIAAVKAQHQQEIATQKATEAARISRKNEETSKFFGHLTKARQQLRNNTAGWKQLAKIEIAAAERLSEMASQNRAEIRSLKAATAIRDDLRPLRVLFEKEHVNKLEYHPSGRFLIAATGRASTLDPFAHIFVFDLTENRLIQTLNFSDAFLLRPSRNGIRAMQFNRSGDVLAFASKTGKIYFHRFDSGRLEQQPYQVVDLKKGEKINQLLKLGDHDFLACHHADASPYYISRISDTSTELKTVELPEERGYGILSVDAATKQLTAYDGGTVYRISTDTLQTTSTSAVPAIAFSLTPQLVIRNEQTGGHLFSLAHEVPICRINFVDAISGFSKNRVTTVSDDWTRVCVVDPLKNQVLLISTSDLKIQTQTALGTASEAPISAQFSPNGQQIAIATYRDVRVFDVDPSETIRSSPGPGTVGSFAPPFTGSDSSATWYRFAVPYLGVVQWVEEEQIKDVFINTSPQITSPIVTTVGNQIVYTGDFSFDGDPGYGKLKWITQDGKQESFAIHKPLQLAKSNTNTLYASGEGKIFEIDLGTVRK